MRDLVAGKLAGTERQIRLLKEFADELKGAVASVGTRHVDGRCGPGCACEPAGAPEGGPALAGHGRRPAEPAPTVCTLEAAAVPGRLDDWAQLLARASAREPIDDGIRLRFDSSEDIATEVARLASAEHRCCSFLTFTLRIDAAAIDLEVTAPREAVGLVHDLLGATP